MSERRRQLRRSVGKLARAGLAPLGLGLVRRESGPRWPHDFDDQMIETCKAVDYYTLTSVERVGALVQAVRHLVSTETPGAMVECGVWRGGSMMAVARTLRETGDTSRQLWMYDTFTSMPDPGERDYDIFGRHASQLLPPDVDPHDIDGYRYLPLTEVKAVLENTGYPFEQMHFIQGLVEETIPAEVPEKIALLRLDTDWYESTKHEMEHLFPRIVDGGILIVDDYGHFKGAREAVDEYFSRIEMQPFLHRIDFTGRLVVVHQRDAR